MGACGSNPCPIASGGTSGVNGAQATGNLAKAAGEGIWKRIGAVDYGPPGTKLMEEPTVIVDTKPELLTAYPTVYKKWGSYGTAIGYAESVDGVQWDQGGIVIPIISAVQCFRSPGLTISGEGPSAEIRSIFTHHRTGTPIGLMCALPRFRPGVLLSAKPILRTEAKSFLAERSICLWRSLRESGFILPLLAPAPTRPFRL